MKTAVFGLCWSIGASFKPIVIEYALPQWGREELYLN